MNTENCSREKQTRKTRSFQDFKCWQGAQFLPSMEKNEKFAVQGNH